MTATALSQEQTPAAAEKAAVAESKVQNVTPEQAERILKENKDAVVLDVRTSEEFKEGHIAGAKNIDFFEDDFAEKVAKLDPSKSYVVHCAAGGRSTQALEKLKAAHLSTIYHMNGGFKAWEKAGKPVQK